MTLFLPLHYPRALNHQQCGEREGTETRDGVWRRTSRTEDRRSLSKTICRCKTACDVYCSSYNVSCKAIMLHGNERREPMPDQDHGSQCQLSHV